MRFTYSMHKSRGRAEQALEHYFATGEVVCGEFPRVEYRGGLYLVTVIG